jgi:S-adenosylmethionine:tRNA ribosyltransferase-isomerase
LNDTRVIPARVLGRRQDTGGKVEVLFVEPMENGIWEAMIRARARPAPGWRLILGPAGELAATVTAHLPNGRYAVRPDTNRFLPEWLESIGMPPLPPYIKRQAGPGRTEDRERYQTVYARQPGAIAAPTAGLHFTDELLHRLESRGIERAMVTLHVGPGTFKPVQSATLAGHVMESERYAINQDTAERVARTRHAGGRIVAVGSTVVRTLETAATEDGTVTAGEGRSAIFLFPPYRFRVVDAMLTNFHLPRSTPLAMVCALAGRDRILAAYREAIREGYRFYSYGDAMLIL